jgi:hypothetical protein
MAVSLRTLHTPAGLVICFTRQQMAELTNLRERLARDVPDMSKVMSKVFAQDAC